MKLLVVDDDPLFRAALRNVLVQAGYAVEEAPNGKVALARLSGQEFDLLITDIFMPEKDGLETLMEVRQQYPSLKVVAMSGGGIGAAVDVLRLAEQLGASSVLAKPFQSADLLHAVTSVLRRA